MITKLSFFRGIKIIGTILLSFVAILLLYINVVSHTDRLPVPVMGATSKDWDKHSFWHSSWAASQVHKGIDIFASHKTPVLTPVSGLVLDAGYSNNGGNYIYILGPKLHIYYFAHLNSIRVKRFQFLKANDLIGEVGNTGNASLKPYHLHFSVSLMLPVFGKYESHTEQGWKKMFYLDPNQLFK